MGLMSKILGDRGSRSLEEYVELDLDDIDDPAATAGLTIHIAEIDDQQDVIEIKDAVYDGDIVIADIVRLRTKDSMVEHIIDELQLVAREVNGDIVQKGDDQLIVSPTGVKISREKLGQ